MTELSVLPKNGGVELTLTLRDVLMPIFRQRRLAMLIFAGICMGTIVGLVLPRKYEAEMKILVNRERVDAVVTPDPESVNGPGIVPAVSEEDLNSEVELLKSRDLLERVVLACGLSREHSSRLDLLADRAESIFPKIWTGATPQEHLAKAVQTLSERLIVDPMRKTTLIRVTYASHDPNLSAQVLQTLGTMYQEKHASVHRPPGTFLFFKNRSGTKKSWQMRKMR
jgi:uncharacterized protein involved in exopolysaccharide biosynthesis